MTPARAKFLNVDEDFWLDFDDFSESVVGVGEFKLSTYEEESVDSPRTATAVLGETNNVVGETT